MRKLMLVLVLVCLNQFSFANDKDKSLFIKAKVLLENKNYSEAIPLLKQYAKDVDETAAKEVYLELANANYALNNTAETLKYLKLAITKAGLTEADFIYSEALDAETSSFLWGYFYENYDDLRSEYVKNHK